MSAGHDFVKSATTTTPVATSQAAVIAMLARYGATGFGFRTRGTIVDVTFHIPRDGGDGEHTVVIPIDVARVRSKLDMPALRRVQAKNKKRSIPDDEQAARVAWRVLYLWIDAALAAVSIGAQSLSDAFFAHLLVTDAGGNTARVADHMAASLARGVVPARLASGTTGGYG